MTSDQSYHMMEIGTKPDTSKAPSEADLSPAFSAVLSASDLLCRESQPQARPSGWLSYLVSQRDSIMVLVGRK